MDVKELRRRVGALTWHHAIDLGGGVVTPGLTDAPIPRHVFPSFEGKSVLDIGAWDGYYSFLAEREGAARVVALDHYAWGVDFDARTRYWDECRAHGVLPDHARDESDFWRPDLPGKQGFDLAREALGSRVEDVVADFMTADLAALGTFVVVLYLGVLYHVRDPLGALERLRRVTREVAVIETEAVWVHGLEHEPLLAFSPGDEMGRRLDFGNWYAPNEAALLGMLRVAGFSRVEMKVGPSPEVHPDIRPASRVDAVLGREVAKPRTVYYRIALWAFL